MALGEGLRPRNFLYNAIDLPALLILFFSNLTFLKSNISVMIRLLSLTLGWLLTNFVGYSQSVDCNNVGFEEGSFQGWERLTGKMSPYIFPLYYTLELGSNYILNGQPGHTITSISDGYDPNVREKIPVVAPGSQHSVRIGDLEVGGYIAQLRTTFVVPADKPLLRYQFAVVLQNPNHQPDHQPGFSFVIRTGNGDTISCGSYEAIATNQTAGFTYQQDDNLFERLIYRNWTAHVLDLRAYAGQSLNLEVTAHDCVEGGHFGYAYFDMQCLTLSPEAISVCTEQGSFIQLATPAGFDRHRWSTGDTTATIRVESQLGDTYWVDVESRSVLNPVCTTTLRLTYRVDQFPIPTTRQVTLCAGESYHLGDSTYTKSGTYRNVLSRPLLCDSLVVTELTVLPIVRSTQQVMLCQGSQLVIGDSTYRTTGTYETRIHRAAPLCDSIVTTQLVMNQLTSNPLRDTLVMQGDSIQLIASNATGTGYVYSWSPKDGLSCPSCAKTWAKPTQTTRYQVIISDSLTGCNTGYDLNVAVIPCALAIPSAFTPNGDGINDTFRVTANPCRGRLRQLTIYNRWGQVVFHQKITAVSDKLLEWDGTYQGEFAHTGVYNYQLTIESTTGTVSNHSGTLTLMH